MNPVVQVYKLSYTEGGVVLQGQLGLQQETPSLSKIEKSLGLSHDRNVDLVWMHGVQSPVLGEKESN